MNASKSSTDPVKCVKAEKLEQDECRGSANATKVPVNAIQEPVNAIRGSVNVTQGSVNAIRGPANARRGLVNAVQGSDECKSWPSQLSPTTATAPHNKPGAPYNKFPIISQMRINPS